MEVINFSVRRPDRTVSVRARVTPFLDPPQYRLERYKKPADRDEPTYLIDADELENKATLIAFFRRITRPEPDGGIVDALIYDLRLPALYDVLKIEPQDGPIVVDVGSDG